MAELREVINLDNVPIEQLKERRDALSTKARSAGGPAGLPEDELREWLECTRQLRKRHAGPPKTKKEKAPADISDML